MRKKFFSGLLMVVAIVAATSTFTSCKDTYADDMQETKGQIKDLNDLTNQLGQNYDQLKQRVTDLEAAKDSCETAIGVLILAVQDLNQRVEALENGVPPTVDAYTKAQTDALIQALQDQINAMKNQIAALQAEDAFLQQQIDNLEPRVTALEGRMTNIEKKANDINLRVDSVISVINDLNTALGIAQATADEAKALAEQALAQTAAVQAAAAAAQAAADAAQAAADQATTAAQAAQTAADNAQAAADAAQAAADAATAALTDLTNRVTAIENKLNDFVTKPEFEAYKTLVGNRLQDISDSLAYAYATATAAYELAVANRALIEAMDPQFGNYYTKDEVNGLVDAAKADAEAAKELADKANELAKKAYILADEAKTVAEEALNNANFAIDETERIEAAFKAADQALSDKIDALETELKNLIQALDDRLSNVEQNLAKLITSILVQGTVNPVTGQLATPFGINSNLLCAFYGENTGADVTFPKFDAATEVVLGSFNTIEIQNGDVIVDGDNEASLGKVYLTINPNTVDFAGQTLTLETSAQNASKVTLSPLAASNYEIFHGYTRAANGFYEAEAKVAAADVQDIKPNIDKEALKGVAKDVINKIKNRSNPLNLQNVYKTVVEQLGNVAPAYALKATWKDADNVEHSIFSQYCLAATAIQPASFKFLEGWDAPQIRRIAEVTYDVNFNLDNVTINPIDVDAYNLTVHVWAIYDGGGKVLGLYNSYADAFAAIGVVPGSTGTPVDLGVLTAAGLQDFIASINSNIIAKTQTSVNKLIEQIKTQTQSNVNTALNKVNTQYINRVNNLIDKVNARIQNINAYLQPAMLYQAADGKWNYLSDSFLAPVAATEGFMVIEPTSITAELLAPAYKKFVAVTNVWTADLSANAQAGANDCLNVLDQANEPIVGNDAIANMKTIFSGSKDMILNVKAGYVYEITYAAVDYSGKTVYNKYYVKGI